MKTLHQNSDGPLVECLTEITFVRWLVERIIFPIKCSLGFHHIWTISNDTGTSTQCLHCDSVFGPVHLYLDRDESLYHRPFTLDLSPNPTLPPLERSLQSALLRVIVEFGGIARDLDFLSSSPKRDGDFLSCMSDAWSEAHTIVFTNTIETHGGKWA